MTDLEEIAEGIKQAFYEGLKESGAPCAPGLEEVCWNNSVAKQLYDSLINQHGEED